ncbi:DoxX family protein [Candidatus Bathyarchaeota archaeon RBG_13_38_9]|nr:MAG: DoxX family protein [Candidatus Bathyarchaeota archaeon RBG_13_38_9]
MKLKDPIPLTARILISTIFIIAAINKSMDLLGSEQYMTAYGIPAAGVLLVLSVIIEIFGGLSILLGFKAKWGAIALFIFLIPTTLIFHTEVTDQIQSMMLLKNLSMMGGLLMVANYGSGPYSLDEHFDLKKKT